MSLRARLALGSRRQCRRLRPGVSAPTIWRSPQCSGRQSCLGHPKVRVPQPADPIRPDLYLPVLLLVTETDYGRLRGLTFMDE